MKKTVAIVVTYNTPELIANAVKSIRNHYKDLHILIVDGSPIDSSCYRIVDEIQLNDIHVSVIHKKENIGHGKGMRIGISNTMEENIILFDSDIIMEKPPIEKMIELLKNNYGVGKIVQVNTTGSNVTEGGIKYLHPYFSLISRTEYHKYSPVIHHGAPFIQSMVDINNKSNSHKLIDFDIENYVTHLGRGTRALNPKEFHPGYWDKPIIP